MSKYGHRWRQYEKKRDAALARYERRIAPYLTPKKSALPAPRDPRILLGQSALTGAPLFATIDDLKLHTALMGSTGAGKSYLLFHLVTQLIARDQGIVLIDPHKQLAEAVLRWAYLEGYEKRLIWFSPSEGCAWLPGLDPFQRRPEQLTSAKYEVRLNYVIGTILTVMRKVSGLKSFDQTPRLERILRAALYVCAVTGLGLTELPHLLNPADGRLREAVLASGLIKDPLVASNFQILANLHKQADLLAQVESSFNRTHDFWSDPVLRRVFGGKRHVIDFHAVMDQGLILLLDLSQEQLALPETTQDFLATMVVALLVAAMRERKKGASRSCFLVIDEFEKFVLPDITSILDEGRGLGLHALLGFHYFDQVRAENPQLFASIRANTNNKLIMKTNSPEDADLLARYFDVDPDLVKDEIWVPFLRPRTAWHEVDEVTESENWSEARSAYEGRSQSESEGTRIDDPAFRFVLYPDAVSRQAQRASTSASSSASQSGGSRTVAHRKVPLTAYDETEIRVGTTFYSIEEQREMVKQQIMGLKRRAAYYLGVGHQTPEPFVTPHTALPDEIISWHRPQLMARFAKQEWANTTEAVNHEIEERQKALLALPAIAVPPLPHKKLKKSHVLTDQNRARPVRSPDPIAEEEPDERPLGPRPRKRRRSAGDPDES